MIGTFKYDFRMHEAAKEGDLGKVKQLIAQGVSVDCVDCRGRTPLHWAAEHGWYAVAELLIRHRCNVNIKEVGCRSHVLCAANKGQREICHLLLQHGAQANCADNRRRNLLHYACSNGWLDVTQRIVESGEVDINAADRYGQTPLMYASRNEDIVAFLIGAGADVHRCNIRKDTVLHMACGYTNVVQLLLKVERLDLNPQNVTGKTPLHQACFWGHPEVVQQLLKAGVDTNIKNNDNETALTVGIKKNSLTLEEIRLFVEKGAFLEDCDYEQISQSTALKELVLKDVDLCTKSILNKFHHHSLPALYRNPNFAEKLPCVKKFKLGAQQMQAIENYVNWEIQTNTLCNIAKARPIVLGVFCVLSLLDRQA